MAVEPQDAHGCVAECRHDLGFAAGANLGVFRGVGEVADPAQFVLDRPVAAQPGGDLGADSATAGTPVEPWRIPRRSRGSGTRASSSNNPSGAGGTSANSPSSGRSHQQRTRWAMMAPSRNHTSPACHACNAAGRTLRSRLCRHRALFREEPGQCCPQPEQLDIRKATVKYNMEERRLDGLSRS